MPARTTFVLGKGGTGRTTVAAALAIASARGGRRTALVSFSDATDLGARIRDEGQPEGIPADLVLTPLDPRAIVDDLVRRLLRFDALADMVLRHPATAPTLDIAPGVQEIAILHRLDALAAEPYDAIVVDGPATGHGIAFLEAPEKVARILAGSFAERVRGFDRALKDKSVTDIVLVTVPEETPVREAVELARRLQARGFPVSRIIVNRGVPSLDQADGEPFLKALAGAAGRDVDAALQAPGISREIVQGLGFIREASREADEHVAMLSVVGLPVTRVPWRGERAGRLQFVAECVLARVPP